MLMQVISAARAVVGRKISLQLLTWQESSLAGRLFDPLYRISTCTSMLCLCEMYA